jgi:hypothetical protein
MMRTVQIELATFQAREQAPAAVPPAVVPAPPIDAVVLAAPYTAGSGRFCFLRARLHLSEVIFLPFFKFMRRAVISGHQRGHGRAIGKREDRRGRVSLHDRLPGSTRYKQKAGSDEVTKR